MPTHTEKRVLPYRPDQMYDLVRSVESYPKFLPWCRALRIRQREVDSDGCELVLADMVIGFKVFREQFTSVIGAKPATKSHPARIDVTYTEGPFKFLNNYWIFKPHLKGVEIDFFVDFEFSSKILEKAIGLVFNEAVQKMVDAFEGRAAQMYTKTDCL